MKSASFGIAMFALAAVVACGTDDGKDDSPSSLGEPGPVEATGASIERGRTETTAVGPSTGAGGAGEPATSPDGAAVGTATAPDALANNPPPVIPPAPPATNASDPACAGKAEGDVCGTPSCQSETHTVEGRCDKQLTCVYVKIKCDRSCEGGLCVDEKPGNGKGASGGKSKS